MTAPPGLTARLASLADLSPAAVPAPGGRLQVVEPEGPGGARVLLASAPRRIVAIRLCWPGGSAGEGAELAGLHAVTMQALIRSRAPGQGLGGAGQGLGGAGQGRRTTIAEHLESAGIAVEAGATERTAYLELRGPREYLSQALTLVTQAVEAAGLDESAFQAARTQARNAARRRRRDLAMLASDTFRVARAEPGNFLARRPEGDEASLDALSVADCRELASKLRSRRLHLIIVGDQQADEYLAAVGALAGYGAPRCASPGGGPPGSPRRASPGGRPPGSPRDQGEGEGGAERPALRRDPPEHLRAPSGMAAHSCLRWGTTVGTATAADLADHVALELAVHVLGGWSGSRWNALFRERLGLTYSVTSAHKSMASAGLTVSLAHVGFAVATKDLATARDLLRKDVDDFIRAGPCAAEVNAAAVRLLRTETHFHDSARKMVGRVGWFLQAGLDPDFAERRITALQQIDADDTRARMAALLRQHTLIVLSDAPE